MKVIIINHGDLFGWKDGSRWLTFYCPYCKNQLMKGMKICKALDEFSNGCGKTIDWETTNLKEKK